MRWSLKNPNAGDLVRAYTHYGQEIPPGLVPPDLHDVEHAYWRAFWDLSTDRQAGMVAGPIPWSSIQRYLELNPGIEQSAFTSIIREMDDVYLSHKDGK